MNLREQLQSTLGTAYTLERELGGGGMSRVFVANESAYGRKVVIKVLPLELTHDVSVDRFKREIQLAAQLQHPHIVPLHTSGETNGVPYYTMPFVEGTSLRALLARGPLGIGESINILREVAKALAYAHDRGVVHRDIKPDNVLLTGGSAVVTDFGIAKALAASRGQRGRDSAPQHPTSALTALGTSIGTPMYMAPEQAAGDPSTDHRADLYAFGCMAYEMLTGAPPFVGKSPHRLLAAHMGEIPEPVTARRPDTPPLLAELVMKCLEKEPENRPASAANLVRVLDEVHTSGGAHPAMPSILLSGRPRLARALSIYAVAFLVMWLIAKAAIIVIGLPAWVVPGTLLVMALGLPVILFTAFVHHGAHAAMTRATVTPGGTFGHSTMTRLAVRASPWITWRRTMLGGAGALGVFALLVAGYMVMRVMGIGPVGSLRAMGTFDDVERLIVADFKSPASDTSLGPVVTEMFRSDLAQSKNLVIFPVATIRQVLARMQRSPSQRVDYALAREIAAREGIKAVIDGEVLSLAGSYVITATLYAGQTGEVLGTFRATAKDSNGVIPAISDLSRDVRTKVGESLRTINSTIPLEQVTTPSLEALKKYVQAVRIFRSTTDYDKGLALLEEAVTIDTAFAMAWRKLSVELINRTGRSERAIRAIEKAYAHRDRLSDVERHMTTGGYFSSGPHHDNERSIAAYEAAAEADPRNSTALNNMAVGYAEQRAWKKGEAVLQRAMAADSGNRTVHLNLIGALIAQAKHVSADSMITTMQRRFPNTPEPIVYRARLAAVRQQFDSAEAILRDFDRARGTERALHTRALLHMSELSLARGRLRESAEQRRELYALNEGIGDASAPLDRAIDDALVAVHFLQDTARAQRIIDEALARQPLTAMNGFDRPFENLAVLYGAMGRADRLKSLLAQFEESRRGMELNDDPISRGLLRGSLAMAEGRYADAAREYRLADNGSCLTCTLPVIAQAYDLAGMTDSATAIFERYTSTVDLYSGFVDQWFLAGSHKRLGELYEAKGDRKHAAEHYESFLSMWKNADPELRPKVDEVRKRLARIRTG